MDKLHIPGFRGSRCLESRLTWAERLLRAGWEPLQPELCHHRSTACLARALRIFAFVNALLL